MHHDLFTAYNIIEIRVFSPSFLISRPPLVADRSVPFSRTLVNPPVIQYPLREIYRLILRVYPTFSSAWCGV